MRQTYGMSGRAAATAVAILTGLSAPASAFPTDQAMVPVAVGAAFALPAVIALITYAISKIVRVLGRVLTLAAFVLIVAGLGETAWPGLARQMIETVGLRWGT